MTEKAISILNKDVDLGPSCFSLLPVDNKILSYKGEIGRGVYTLKNDHFPIWEEIIENKDFNIYDRLVACFVVLDFKNKAKLFLENSIKSDNKNIRFNAARVIQSYISKDSKKVWGINCLLSSINNSMLDENQENDLKLENDKTFLVSPISEIFRDFGEMKLESAVPLLEKYADMNTSAIYALGEIGNEKSKKILLNVLLKNSLTKVPLEHIIQALIECKEKGVFLKIKEILDDNSEKYIGQPVIIEKCMDAIWDLDAKNLLPQIENLLHRNLPVGIIEYGNCIKTAFQTNSPEKELLRIYDNEKKVKGKIIKMLKKFPCRNVFQKLQWIILNEPFSLKLSALNALLSFESVESIAYFSKIFAWDFSKNPDHFQKSKSSPEAFANRILLDFSEKVKMEFKSSQEAHDWIVKNKL